MEEIRKQLACEVLVDLDNAGPGPMHERLGRVLRTAIREGVLRADSILPASRVLASDLGCSRWVVTQAYDQLVAEGYLIARTGSATRVSKLAQSTRAPETGPPHEAASGPTVRYDLAPGLPDLREFPRRRWAEAIGSRLRTLSHEELGYPDPHGHEQLRRGLGGYLGRVRGADAHPDHITICSSITEGVTRMCRTLLAAGIGRVAVEDPGWTRLREQVAATGIDVVGVPVDEHGLCVSSLAAHADVRAVLLTPAHQFPNGVVLAPERRAALLDWAREVDGVVLEDDYDAEFRYDRRPIGTLQGTDPARVALFGSVSKTLSPAVGLGWAVTPPRWTPDVRARGRAPSGLEQQGFVAFLGTGEYDRQLRGARQRYRRRRDLLVAALESRLPQCELSGIAAGLHVLLRLPAGTDAASVVAAAARAGVRVANLDDYRLAPVPRAPALVLGYGNLPDRAVTPAVDLLAEAIAGPETGSGGGPTGDRLPLAQ